MQIRVQEQLSEGIAVDEVKIDMRLSVMKELEVKWIASTYDCLCANTSIGYNGFKAAGIIYAVQNVLQAEQENAAAESDPFEDLD